MSVFVVVIEDENGESTQIHSVHQDKESAEEEAKSIERTTALLAYVEEHEVH